MHLLKPHPHSKAGAFHQYIDHHSLFTGFPVVALRILYPYSLQPLIEAYRHGLLGADQASIHNKNADFIDDVRANKHIKQTGILMRDIILSFFGEDFSIVTIKPDGDALQIDLIPHANHSPSYGGSQKPCSTTYEYCERTVRDLPILGRGVRLCVLLRRVGCRDCGKRMEAISWLDRYAHTVIQACERLPPLHVAQMFGLHWDTVRLLERRALQAVLSELPNAQPRRAW
ncbi:hypothetical protein ACIOZM_20650 [Pseudomonas sp. NPDC087346]|uniref:hypothetical protein n=1 Tax=Pseudomonas sp. NPDC087346 TaxID=3364438 RepID=UPI00380C36A4